MVERILAVIGGVFAGACLIGLILLGIQRLKHRRDLRCPLPPMDPEVVRELQMAYARLPYLQADERMYLHAELKGMERGERP
ncbi:hypothetical protein ACFWYW_57530 [Nonomuraea sp. NPDC059023]|uniref:hypothetical protein n=1 Tax=unclassified Nonomuraea TaxID=2593643 RepID=UPI0036ADC070